MFDRGQSPPRGGCDRRASADHDQGCECADRRRVSWSPIVVRHGPPCRGRSAAGEKSKSERLLMTTLLDESRSSSAWSAVYSMALVS